VSSLTPKGIPLKVVAGVCRLAQLNNFAFSLNDNCISIAYRCEHKIHEHYDYQWRPRKCSNEFENWSESPPSLLLP
jgi:hypothetical protein